MTCPDCLYGYCIGVDCDKAIAAYNELQKQVPNLKGIWDKHGTNSNRPVAVAESRTAQER